ncbi:MAG: MarR family winged helix-turn-helix transcriptional regulator [Longimicrobiales bacterium]
MSKNARASTKGGRTQQALELADRLHSASIHLLRRVRREDTASGLPAPQLSALSVLVFRGPLTLGALAEAEQVRPPTMTRVVAALAAAGLVEREVQANDRRVAIIRATGRGQEVLAEGRLRRVAALARELAALPAAARSVLNAGLDVLERVVGPRTAAAGRSR